MLNQLGASTSKLRSGLIHNNQVSPESGARTLGCPPSLFSNSLMKPRKWDYSNLDGISNWYFGAVMRLTDALLVVFNRKPFKCCLEMNHFREMRLKSTIFETLFWIKMTLTWITLKINSILLLFEEIESIWVYYLDFLERTPVEIGLNILWKYLKPHPKIILVF